MTARLDTDCDCEPYVLEFVFLVVFLNGRESISKCVWAFSFLTLYL